MYSKPINLFTFYGFSVRLDLSWIIIAVLITWSLARGVFPALAPHLAGGTYWTMGIVGALGLFVSILIHEFFHAMVAKRNGMQIKGITLFIFGGVAEMEDEPPSPKIEFLMTIVGPIASVVIGLICYTVRAIGDGVFPVPVQGVLSYLAYINILLAVFNLIPAFPLDGGRVLRSALWYWKGNLRWATRIVTALGSGFGLLLIFLGVLSIISGRFVGGLWWFLIGLFLRGAAESSYRQVLLRRAFEGEPVRRFMVPHLVAVPRNTPLKDLVDDYVYRFHLRTFPIVSEGKLVGCVNADRIREVPHDQWNSLTVEAVSEPCSPNYTVDANTDAMKALSIMQQSGATQLFVTEGDRLVGMLSLSDIVNLFALKMELEGDGEVLEQQPTRRAA